MTKSKKEKLKNLEAVEDENAEDVGTATSVEAVAKKVKKAKKESAKEEGDNEEDQQVMEGKPEKKQKKKKKKVETASEGGSAEGGVEAKETNKKRKKEKDEVNKGDDGAQEGGKEGEKKKKKKAASTETIEASTIDPDRIHANGSTSPAPSSVLKAAGSAAADASVSVSGNKSGAVEPLNTFAAVNAALSLPPSLAAACSQFSRPTTIQSYTWPVLLSLHRDFIGIAKTGSGKTLAFGIPAVLQALQAAEGGAAKGSGGQRKGAAAPAALVLAPTRELAQQIAEVLDGVARPCSISVVCVFGGVNKQEQRQQLKKQPGIVVATPGRLQDFMDEGSCDLSRIKFTVLDEADRMLDLGFEEPIRAILNATPKARQTAMLSATWPTGVSKLASEFLRDPIKVVIGSEDLAANHDVQQIVEVIDVNRRDARLDALLRTYHKSRDNRVLVFALYKKEAQRLETFLSSRGWKVRGVHGDKSQAERTKAVDEFRSGSVPLLVATDVASRGLDIPDVEFVINYTFPLTTEDYIHRIGRTGRAGRKGIAHTLFTHDDRAKAGGLVNVLREAGQKVPEELLKFGTTVKKKESKLYGAHFRDITEDAPKAKKIKFDESDED